MFKMIESLREKFGSVACAQDMQSAHRFGSDKVLDEVPTDVDMLGSVVKVGVIRQGDSTCIIHVNVHRLVEGNV